MDNNVLEIKPVSLGPWITLEYHRKQEPRRVKPVAKAEKGLLKGSSRKSDAQHGETISAISSELARELVDNVQTYLADLNISLSFEVYEQTGELVVKVINRDTLEVMRQMHPEDLLKLHDKLEDLRGVLFNGKA